MHALLSGRIGGTGHASIGFAFGPGGACAVRVDDPAPAIAVAVQVVREVAASGGVAVTVPALRRLVERHAGDVEAGAVRHGRRDVGNWIGRGVIVTSMRVRSVRTTCG